MDYQQYCSDISDDELVRVTQHIEKPGTSENVADDHDYERLLVQATQEAENSFLGQTASNSNQLATVSLLLYCRLQETVLSMSLSERYVCPMSV